MNLGGVEGHWAVLHEAVNKETGLDPAVISIGLLGDRVLGAANKGPFALVGMAKSTEVFILDEAEALHSVFTAVVSGEVIGDVGVKVCDGGGHEVDGKACPMIAIPVEGKEEFAVSEGRAVGELVAPACEPSFDEMEGVLGGVGVLGSLRGWVYQLSPDEGAKTVAA